MSIKDAALPANGRHADSHLRGEGGEGGEEHAPPARAEAVCVIVCMGVFVSGR